MPLWEFSCGGCGEEFELLLLGRSGEREECPRCGGTKLERLLSVPGVKSDGTRDLAMRAARKRDAHQARDRINERRRYEESHDRHGH